MICGFVKDYWVGYVENVFKEDKEIRRLWNILGEVEVWIGYLVMIELSRE